MWALRELKTTGNLITNIVRDKMGKLLFTLNMTFSGITRYHFRFSCFYVSYINYFDGGEEQDYYQHLLDKAEGIFSQYVWQQN